MNTFQVFILSAALTVTNIIGCKVRQNSELHQLSSTQKTNATADIYKYETSGTSNYKMSYLSKQSNGFLFFANTTSNFAIFKVLHTLKNTPLGGAHDKSVYQSITPAAPSPSKLDLSKHSEKGYTPTYAKIDDDETPIIAATLSQDTLHAAISTKYQTYLLTWPQVSFSGEFEYKKIADEGASHLSFSPNGKYLGISFEGDNRLACYDLHLASMSKFSSDQISRTDISNPYLKVGWNTDNQDIGMYGIHRSGIHLLFVSRAERTDTLADIPNFTQFKLNEFEEMKTASVSVNGEVAAVTYYNGDTQRDKEGKKRVAGYYLRFFKPRLRTQSSEGSSTRPSPGLQLENKYYYDFEQSIMEYLNGVNSAPIHVHLEKIVEPQSELLQREGVTFRDVSFISSDGNEDYPNFRSIRIQHRPSIVKENQVQFVFGDDRLTTNPTPWSATHKTKEHPAHHEYKTLDIKWSSPLSHHDSLYHLITDRKAGLFLYKLYETN